jgi:MerR family copper efflux transcriptional regulator
MNIGAAAQASGVSAKMIRHYESLGILPQAARSDAGYRRYTDADVARLAFVRRARAAGFSLAETGRLLALWTSDRRTARDVRALAAHHLADVRARLVELQAIADTLEHLVAHCHGDERPECPIMDALDGTGDRKGAAKPRGPVRR